MDHATLNDRDDMRSQYTPKGTRNEAQDQNALTITKTLDSVMSVFKNTGGNLDQG